MDIPTKVALMRFKYHANMLDVNNILNQLGFRNNDKAESIGKKHAMTIITDVLPRLGYDINKYFNDKEQP